MATKKPGKSMSKWDEDLARRAALAMSMEENSLGTGNSISTQGGVLKYRDAEVPDNKMNVIILDHTFLNTYYEGGFDPENPSNPLCFAIGKSEKGLAPHEKAEQPQHDICATCELGGKEAWGTADKGKGKACKNVRRLILIPENALEDIESSQPATMKVPVTSVKAWAGYVKQLKDGLSRPPCAVITEISLKNHPKHQFDVVFKLVGKVDEEHLEDLFAKVDSPGVQQQLLAPYTPFEQEEKASKRPSKALAKKAVNKAGRGRR